MKIVKKVLLGIFMLLAFTSCSLLFPNSGPEITTISTPAPFTRAQRRVYIEGATVGLEKAIKSKLLHYKI